MQVIDHLLTTMAVAIASPAAPDPPPTAAPRVFIVTCDTAGEGDRQRIALAVRRGGGRILYHYRAIGGMAVAAPARGDPARFERLLRRIRGVIAVQPDGVAHTTAVTGRP